MTGIGRAFTLLAFTFIGWLAAPALAQEGPTPPPLPPENANEGLGFLIISLTSDFGTDTPTIVVSLGTFVGGADPAATTFVSFEGVVLPVSLPEPYTFEGLNGNEVTILGSVQTTGGEEEDPVTHLLTADGGAVDADVQEAVYNATRDAGFGDLFWDSEGEVPLFPTTTEIATFIAGFPPLTSGEEGSPPFEASSEDIAAVADAIFETDDFLNYNGVTASVECDGEVFPHDPDPAVLAYSVMADSDGNVTSDFCDPVDIDIKPGSDTNPINIGKKGSLPVAILGTEDFDVLDIDDTTVSIGGVFAEKCSVEDVNDDGEDDLVCHFDVPELVEAGVLDEESTLLAVRAELAGGDGDCVGGSDVVTIKKK